MANKISCREGVYGGWQKAAACLPKAGIRHIELEVKSREDMLAANEGCRAQGVTPLTISGSIKCSDADSIAAAAAACDTAQEIGVRHFFLSAHGDDYDASMRVLAELGDRAAAHNVTICLETHPPFCRNAAEMLRTMAAVQHDHVRINFDTANIMYYNEKYDSVTELNKVVEYVASVHLKDSDGSFHSMNFPVFGEGIIDFPAVFKTLRASKFDGPLTMELEGPLLKGLDTDGCHQKVVACMRYLRSIGAAE